MTRSSLSILAGDKELVAGILKEGKLLIGVSGYPGVVLDTEDQETLLSYLVANLENQDELERSRKA